LASDYIVSDYKGKNLSCNAHNLRGADLKGMIDFSGANLTGADVRGVDLNGMVNFSGAILDDVEFSGSVTDKGLIDLNGADIREKKLGWKRFLR